MKQTMKLEYNDFIISPNDVCRNRFDVYRKGLTKKGTPKEEIVGYGYTFQNALLEIAFVKTSENQEVDDLMGYIDYFNYIVEDLKKCIV